MYMYMVPRDKYAKRWSPGTSTPNGGPPETSTPNGGPPGKSTPNGGPPGKSTPNGGPPGQVRQTVVPPDQKNTFGDPGTQNKIFLGGPGTKKKIFSKKFFSKFSNFWIFKIGQKTQKNIFGVKIRPKKFFRPFLRPLKRVK